MNQKVVRGQLETILRDMASDSSIWFGDEIPRKKLKAAIESYAKGVVAERVIALHDSTLFGGADEGFLITDAAFYCAGKFGRMTPTTIRFERYWGFTSKQLDREKYVVIVSQGEEASIEFVFPNVHPYRMAGKFQVFLRQVISLRRQGLLATEDRYVIVQDMSEEFRIEYVKVAVLLALSDDSKISPEELAEVQLLMTRLELSPAARRELWSFIARDPETLDAVLERLERLAPKGARDVLVLSLLKDFMVVARGRGGSEPAAADPFIADVARRYSVSPAKCAFIEEAIAFDKAVFSGAVKAGQLKKMGVDLAAKSAAVGVPLVAVYLSGSVVGLSAAGITSGLAALGFGGVFGLGAMVTGIGTVVLIGVAVYQLVRWLSGSEEEELAALREKLMQEVIKQQQRTVNALLGDIQALTAKVVELTAVEAMDKVRIRRLTQEVQALSAAMVTLATRAQQGRDVAPVKS